MTSKGSDSLLGIKRGKSVKNCQKHVFIWANRSILRAIYLNYDPINQVTIIHGWEFTLTLFCSKWLILKIGESNFAQGWSFLKSDKSKLLTVALYSERFWAKEWRAKERRAVIGTLSIIVILAFIAKHTFIAMHTIIVMLSIIVAIAISAILLNVIFAIHSINTVQSFQL